MKIGNGLKNIKDMKIRTILKLIFFIIIAGGLLYLVFASEEGDGDIQTPGVPPIEAPEEEPEDEGLPVIEEPEQVDVDEEELEEALEELADLPIQVDETQDEIVGHAFLLANNHYEMYLKEENLSIILRDIETGALMYSTAEAPVGGNVSWTNFMKSGIVLEYIVGTNIVTHRADMYSEDPVVDLNIQGDGFQASIYWPSIEIGFDLHVSLTEKGLTVDIPESSIVEESNRYKIGSLYVYPFLGHTLLGEREGYMMIPDGSGALIHLDDKEDKFRQPYTAMIYGQNYGVDDPFVLSLFNRMNPFNDPEQVMMPVFGMVHTDTALGYVGIIEEGQYSARLEAYPNGAILPYNWITPKFIYRQVYNQPTSQDTGTMVVRQSTRNRFDVRIHYHFVSGEEANYVGLAKNYREYLLENEYLSAKEENFSMRVDLLGAEVEQGLIFKKTVPMTTFSEAYDILSDIKGQGAEEIISIYKGWNDKGPVGGLPIRNFNVDSALSDGTSIEELISQLDEKDIKLYLEHDALRINMEEMGTTRHTVMRKFNRRRHIDEVHGKVYRELNFLHPQSTVNIMESMLDRYKNNDVERLMISGISNTLFSYSENNREFDRIDTKDHYQPLIETYNENFDLLLDQPFSYLWNQTGAIVNAPATSSNFVFVDEDIPFLTLVLKGTLPMYSEYINFQANQDEFFLKMIEQSLNPSFLITQASPAALINTNSSYIYSSEYERYEETIQSYYQELEAVYNEVSGAMIDDYERLGSVTRVAYDNGVEVYVNYSENPLNFGAYTIEPLSYKVVNQE